jgi:hypothetical protein
VTGPAAVPHPRGDLGASAVDDMRGLATLRRSLAMNSYWPTFITGSGNGTKDDACVAVGPVDCIHRNIGTSPDTKSRTSASSTRRVHRLRRVLRACPVDTIYAADQVPPQLQHFAQLNAGFYAARESDDQMAV